MIEQAGRWVLDENTDHLLISVCTPEGLLPVAKIQWDRRAKSPYIKTIQTRFQDYIVTWDDFKNFVKLVDEAYYRAAKAVSK